MNRRTFLATLAGAVTTAIAPKPALPAWKSKLWTIPYRAHYAQIKFLSKPEVPLTFGGAPMLTHELLDNNRLYTISSAWIDLGRIDTHYPRRVGLITNIGEGADA